MTAMHANEIVLCFYFAWWTLIINQYPTFLYLLQGDQAVQLLPPQRSLCWLRGLQHDQHDHLRRHPDPALAAAQLPQALVALHRRRRHVPRLLLHRARPLHCQDCRSLLHNSSVIHSPTDIFCLRLHCTTRTLTTHAYSLIFFSSVHMIHY